MRAIVFGVSGNSGHYVASDLLAEGWEVTGVARSESRIEHSGYTHVVGDIVDHDLYGQLPSRVELVVNFAGVQPSILSPRQAEYFNEELDAYLRVNLFGTANVLKFAVESNAGTYIFASSHRDIEQHWSEWDALPNDLPFAVNYSGDHALYAVSKVAGSMLGSFFGANFPLRVFNLRLPMMFLVPKSPLYQVAGTQRIMPFLSIIRDAMAGRNLEIWGDPEMRRDYVHVNNLVNLVKLCERSSLAGGTFSVGTGEGVTTERFVRTIAEEFGPRDGSIGFEYFPENITYKRAVYDVSEQKKSLGYKPILLDEMLSLLHSELESRGLPEEWGWR